MRAQGLQVGLPVFLTEAADFKAGMSTSSFGLVKSAVMVESSMITNFSDMVYPTGGSAGGGLPIFRAAAGVTLSILSKVVTKVPTSSRSTSHASSAMDWDLKTRSM